MNLGGTIRLNRIGIILIIGACIVLLLYMNAFTEFFTEDKSDLEKVSSSINLKQLLIAAIEVAEKGGKEVISVRNGLNLHEQSKGKTKEGVNDPVTQADLNSHCVMYYNLKQTFPKMKVISEEKAAEKDCSYLPLLDLDASILHLSEALHDEHVPAEDVAVWIDPLDATKEYTENLLQYVTTMVCIAIKGKPIIGVIHKPFSAKSTTSWAWVGKASSQDLKHKKSEDVKVKIIVSRSHAGEVANVTRRLLGQDVEVISAGGAGYKTLEVASGNVTAYVHTTAIKKWDVCAGDAILSAMGGKMTTLANQLIDYSSGDNVVNENGILGTMERHDYFIEKFSAYKT